MFLRIICFCYAQNNCNVIVFLLQLSLRDNPLVVRFVSDMTHNPASLLELAARSVKVHNVYVQLGDIPFTLFNYLDSAHRCVNTKCKGI